MSRLKEFASRFKFADRNEPKSAPPAQEKAKRVVNPSPTEKPNNQKSIRKTEIKYTAHFDGLVDIVEHEKKSAFLIKNGSELEICQKIELDGQSFLPPPIDRIPFLLVPGVDVISQYSLIRPPNFSIAGNKLFESVKNYLNEISELPSEEHYDLCATWIIHTYRLEFMQYSPMLWLYAISERGKTRTGKGMILASYRGMHVESLNQAYILRASRDLKASLFLDVFDIWEKAVRKDSVDVLLLRFEKDALVPRVLFPEKGPFKDTEFFSVFGPTIIGTNRSVDSTLESRSIQIVMQESNRKFEKNVTPESALSLRAALLAYRAVFIKCELPEMQKSFGGRYGDLTKPLIQIVREIAPGCEEKLLSVLKTIEGQRLTSKSESFEATVLTAILSKTKDMNYGLLPVKSITEAINTDRADSKRISPQKVGRILKSLGLFTKRTTRNGAASLVWEEEKINGLLRKHGLDEMPETSETSGEPPVKTEISEDSEGLNLPF